MPFTIPICYTLSLIRSVCFITSYINKKNTNKTQKHKNSKMICCFTPFQMLIKKFRRFHPKKKLHVDQPETKINRIFGRKKKFLHSHMIMII